MIRALSILIEQFFFYNMFELWLWLFRVYFGKPGKLDRWSKTLPLPLEVGALGSRHVCLGENTAGKTTFHVFDDQF